MNANELADKLENKDRLWNVDEKLMIETCAMLRQQQAEIEALKKSCLDEITKRVYADQTTKVMEGYWEEAQEEIERLKVQYGICEDKK